MDSLFTHYSFLLLILGATMLRGSITLIVLDLERRHSPAIEMGLSGQEAVPEELPEEVCKGVLLVVREALTNGRRHSSARRVRIALAVTEADLLL